MGCRFGTVSSTSCPLSLTLEVTFRCSGLVIVSCFRDTSTARVYFCPFIVTLSSRPSTLSGLLRLVSLVLCSIDWAERNPVGVLTDAVRRARRLSPLPVVSCHKTVPLGYVTVRDSRESTTIILRPPQHLLTRRMAPFESRSVEYVDSRSIAVMSATVELLSVWFESRRYPPPAGSSL